MGMPYLFAAVAFVVSLRARASRVAAVFAGGTPRPRLAALLIAALCGVTWLHLRWLDDATAAAAMPPWQRAMPLQFFPHGTFETGRETTLESLVQAASFAQSALLVALVFVLRCGERMTRTVAVAVACGAIVLALEAWRARLAGPDIYAYVAFGLSAHAYRPDGIPLPVADRAISHLWGRPLVPCPYGPAWLALAHAITAPFRTLATQTAAFRACGIATMACCAAALVAARKPLTAALFALDPTLWQLYVAEAHNDLVAVALVLAAVACRRRPAAAVLLVALAGAVKLPFLAIGVVAFTNAGTPRARALHALGAAAGGIALSAAFGGADYVAAMRATAALYAHPAGRTIGLLHAADAAIGLAALAAAVLAARFVWGAPWSFVAFGQYPAWQYLGWGIPYAIFDETQGALYLALLPVGGLELTLLFPNSAVLGIGRVALLGALLGAYAYAVRRRAARTPARPQALEWSVRATMRR